MITKKFKVKISAYLHSTDFIIECVETPIDIENAIIDRLGKSDIKWESLGEMHDPRVNRITYEEDIEDATTSTRPLHTEEGSGSRVGAGAS